MLVLPIIIFVLIIAIGAYLGITIPNDIKAAKQSEVNFLQMQVDALMDVGTQHEESLLMLGMLQLQAESFSKTEIDSATPLEVLKALEESSPEDILMDSISYADGTILIHGEMPDDMTLAQLLVGIQRNDIFESYDINSTAALDNRSYLFLEGEEDLGRTFSISLKLRTTNLELEEGGGEE